MKYIIYSTVKVTTHEIFCIKIKYPYSSKKYCVKLTITAILGADGRHHGKNSIILNAKDSFTIPPYAYFHI